MDLANINGWMEKIVEKLQEKYIVYKNIEGNIILTAFLSETYKYNTSPIFIYLTINEKIMTLNVRIDDIEKVEEIQEYVSKAISLKPYVFYKEK